MINQYEKNTIWRILQSVEWRRLPIPARSGSEDGMSKITDVVYSRLRGELLNGKYPPGAHLIENDLAAEMDVSRTPVRAALRRLVSDKLLVAERHRGIFVAEWTSHDTDEVFGLRSVLEPYAAGLASARATDEQFARIAEINREMETVVRENGRAAAARIERLNHAFHEAMIDAAGSARLRSILTKLREIPVLSSTFFLYDDEMMMRSVQQHWNIVDALQARNRLAASHAVTVHLLLGYERMKTMNSNI